MYESFDGAIYMHGGKFLQLSYFAILNHCMSFSIQLCNSTYKCSNIIVAIAAMVKQVSVFSHITKSLAGPYVHSGHENLNDCNITVPASILQQIWCIHLSQLSHEICNIYSQLSHAQSYSIYVASHTVASYMLRHPYIPSWDT